MDTLGRDVESILSALSIRLLDRRQVRWGKGALVSFLNDGVERLADALVFQRTEVFVPAGGLEWFTLTVEARVVDGVRWNDQALSPADVATVAQEFGAGWATLTGGPKYYLPDRLGVRLVPAPVNAGTALTFGLAPLIGDYEGRGPMGDGYRAHRLSSGVVWHWHSGDGTATEPAAGQNVEVAFRYLPAELVEGSRIPRRLARALQAWACVRALEFPRDDAEARMLQVVTLEWEGLLASLKGSTGPEGMSSEQVTGRTMEGGL